MAANPPRPSNPLWFASAAELRTIASYATQVTTPARELAATLGNMRAYRAAPLLKLEAIIVDARRGR